MNAPETKPVNSVVVNLLERIRQRQIENPMPEKLRLRLEHEDRLKDPNTPEGRAELRRRRLLSAGVQDRHVVEAIAPAGEPPTVNDIVPEVMQAAELGWSAGVRTFALLGGVGTGKTWAACWLLAKVNDGLFLPAGHIRPEKSWDALKARAEDCALLVINDLRPGNEWRTQEVGDLLCERHDADLGTVITANWTLTAAEAKRRGLPAGHSVESALGLAVVDRLIDRGRGSHFFAQGASLRAAR
jgi:hypothetical protein